MHWKLFSVLIKLPPWSSACLYILVGDTAGTRLCFGLPAPGTGLPLLTISSPTFPFPSMSSLFLCNLQLEQGMMGDEKASIESGEKDSGESWGPHLGIWTSPWTQWRVSRQKHKCCVKTKQEEVWGSCRASDWEFNSSGKRQWPYSTSKWRQK